MASGSRTNTGKELVNYEPTTWDLVYTGEEVNHHSTIVSNHPACLVQLLSHLQKAKEYVKLLADARHDEDAIEIELSHPQDYYKAFCRMLKNSSGRLPKIQPSKIYSHKSVSI
jgi:hypothetical protein